MFLQLFAFLSTVEKSQLFLPFFVLTFRLAAVNLDISSEFAELDSCQHLVYASFVARLSTGNLPWPIGTKQITKLKIESQNPKTKSQNSKQNHKTQNRIAKPKTKSQNPKQNHKTQNRNAKLKTQTQNQKWKHEIAE